jgi:hypothetical protein
MWCQIMPGGRAAAETLTPMAIRVKIVFPERVNRSTCTLPCKSGTSAAEPRRFHVRIPWTSLAGPTGRARAAFPPKEQNSNAVWPRHAISLARENPQYPPPTAYSPLAAPSGPADGSHFYTPGVGSLAAG